MKTFEALLTINQSGLLDVIQGLQCLLRHCNVPFPLQCSILEDTQLEPVYRRVRLHCELLLCHSNQGQLNIKTGQQLLKSIVEIAEPLPIQNRNCVHFITWNGQRRMVNGKRWSYIKFCPSTPFGAVVLLRRVSRHQSICEMQITMDRVVTIKLLSVCKGLGTVPGTRWAFSKYFVLLWPLLSCAIWYEKDASLNLHFTRHLLDNFVTVIWSWASPANWK